MKLSIFLLFVYFYFMGCQDFLQNEVGARPPEVITSYLMTAENDTALQQTVMNLLVASKENLIKTYDKTLAETKAHAVDVTGKRIETEKQFATAFINGILGIAKNSNSIVSNGDINKVNQLGGSFVQLLLNIAQNEKIFATTGEIKNQTAIFNELLQNKKEMYEVIIKAKNAFERQNGVQLSSTALFSFY
jgi:hypothetical protein